MTESLFPGAHIPPPGAPIDPDRLPHLHRVLGEHYGQPEPRTPWNPLKQFVYSLLSARTRSPASDQVMADLEARFGPGPFGTDWEAVRDAPLADIEHTIQVVTFPETKAPRLKLALQQITARYGSLTLDFLANYRTEKIRAWLEGFEGVGPQVSAAIVNFSTLRRRAISLDANHLRVVHRLGLTPPGDARRTEELLMRMVPRPGPPRCSTSTIPCSKFTARPSVPSSNPAARYARSSITASMASALSETGTHRMNPSPTCHL